MWGEKIRKIIGLCYCLYGKNDPETVLSTLFSRTGTDQVLLSRTNRLLVSTVTVKLSSGFSTATYDQFLLSPTIADTL